MNSLWTFSGLFALAFTPLVMAAQLTPVPDFGANPGNLNMHVHAPAGLRAHAPVVVAMHGCLQTAATYAVESGWNELADRYGFLVIYPEQRPTNNDKNCFSWFEDEDINRDQGEALSIRNMVLHAQRQYRAHARRVYVTGLSAGGCMTAVMLATYPEVFAGGAVMAGIPYKATTSLAGAIPAMRGEVAQTPTEWGALVKEQNPAYGGRYPRLVIFHGAEDVVVSKQNMQELVDQWTHLHGIDGVQPQEEPGFDGNPDVLRRTYPGKRGKPAVVTYEIADMGHALAVNPGQGPKEGGATGPFAADVDFYCTYWAAAFFGLAD